MDIGRSLIYNNILYTRILKYLHCTYTHFLKRFQPTKYYETSGRLVFVRFLEEIEDTKKTFRNYLTFRQRKQVLPDGKIGCRILMVSHKIIYQRCLIPCIK